MEHKGEKDTTSEGPPNIYAKVLCSLKPEVLNTIEDCDINVRIVIEEITGIKFSTDTSICGTWSEVELARQLLDEMVSVPSDRCDNDVRSPGDTGNLQIGGCQHDPCRWRSESFPVRKEIIQFMILCSDGEVEGVLENHTLFVGTSKDQESASVQCCGEDQKDAESVLERFKDCYKSTADRLWIGEFPCCRMLDDRFCRFLLKQIQCIVLSESDNTTVIVCDRKAKDKVTNILHKICAAMHDNSVSQWSDNATGENEGITSSSRASNRSDAISVTRVVSTAEKPTLGIPSQKPSEKTVPPEYRHVTPMPRKKSTIVTSQHISPNEVAYSASANNLSRGFLIKNDVRVLIHKCDITKLHVGAVSYISDKIAIQVEGLARAIYDAAGPQLEKEIRYYLNSSEQVPVGGIVVSSAGNLPCERVIHAVGPPKWTSVTDQGTKRHHLERLRETFRNIILTADKYGFSSLALPAMISGVGRDMDNEQTRIIYEVLSRTYIEMLEEIHIVDLNERVISKIVGAFLEFSKKQQSDKIRKTIELDQDIVHSIIQIRMRKMPKELKIYNRVKIFIYFDDITSLKVDAIVCPNDDKLSCYTGLAKRIANIAGSEYKQLCKNAAKHKKLQPSDVVSINTDCLGVIINAVVPLLAIFFGTVSKYTPDTYKNILRSAAKRSIEETRKHDIRSLAMFPLGIGQEHVPNLWVAEALCQALMESLKRDEQLKEIHIVDTNADFLSLMWCELHRQLNDFIDTCRTRGPHATSRRAMDQTSHYKQPDTSRESVPMTYSFRGNTSKLKESNISAEPFSVTYTLRSDTFSVKETNISKGVCRMKHAVPDQISRRRKASIPRVASTKLPSRPQRQVALPERSVSSADRTERKKYISFGSSEPVPLSQCDARCGFLVGSNVQVFIHKCNITELEVDAIVNAGNSMLCHRKGTAKEIARAAGPELEKEGREIIRRSGPIPIAGTVVTSAGRLPCKKVIHAVGPSWPFAATDEKEKRCLYLLRDTLDNIVHTADKHGLRTLAIPAIICGDGGTSKQAAARITSDTLVYLSRHSRVKEIHLICAAADAVPVFAEAFLAMSNTKSELPQVTVLPEDKMSASLQMRIAKKFKDLVVNDGVKVLLSWDDITKINADAIACSNDKRLSCSTGLAKQIAELLGREYKRVCLRAAKDKKLCPSDAVSIKTRDHGIIINVVVYDLSSSFRTYIKYNDVAYTELKYKSYRNVFTEAKKHGVTRLAIKPVGAGQKHFPHFWPARVLCEALMDGIKSDEALREIHIVDRNRDFLMALWDELRKRVLRATSSDDEVQAKLTKISAPNLVDTRKEPTVTKVLTLSSNQTPPETRPLSTRSEGKPSSEVSTRRTQKAKHLSEELVSMPTYKVPCGYLLGNGIKVFIHRCDITKMEVDAIVNDANRNLQHEAGLAKAIADAAGPDLEEEGREIINNSGLIAVSQTVVTSAGNLPCTKVIHAVRPGWAHSDGEERQQHCFEVLRDTFTNILRTADKYGFSSLAIPAVLSSTGVSSKDDAAIIYEMVASVFGLPKYKVASITCEVLIDSQPDHLKEVHIVDAKTNVLQLIGGALHKMAQLKGSNKYREVIELSENIVSSTIEMCTEKHYGVMRAKTITVIFSSESLTTLKADAILCFNDEKLSSLVGLAKTVADTAGEQYQKQCKQTAQSKKLQTSDIVCIRTANLGIVIHAIVPSGITQYTKVAYKETVYSALERAFKKARTFGISRLIMSPTGVDRHHLIEVWLAEAMCQAIIDLEEVDKQLKEIYIVDFDKTSLRLLRSQLSTQVSIIGPNLTEETTEAGAMSKDGDVGGLNLLETTAAGCIDSSLPGPSPKRRCQLPCGFLINSTIQVLIYTCDVGTLDVDAVVRFIDDVVDERANLGGYALTPSSIAKISRAAVTSGGDLACKLIIHAVGPDWSTADDDEERRRCLKRLRSTFIDILHTADECAIKSLAIPAPSGFSSTPSDREIARVVCDVLLRTKSHHPNKIHLVDISDDFLSLIGGCFAQMKNTAGLRSEGHTVTVLSPDQVTSMIPKHATTSGRRQVLADRRAKIFVYRGDITKLAADAIVCSNDKKLSCSSGLAKRIARLAGKQYKLRCHQAAKDRKLRPSDIVSIETNALGLIINVVLPPVTMFTKEVKKYDVGVYRKLLSASFQNVLDEARERRISCLAVSPLGAGQKCIPNFWIADAMHQVMKDMAKLDRQTKEIHIVHTNKALVMVLKHKLEKYISTLSDSSLFAQQILRASNYQLPCGYQMQHGLKVYIHELDITRLKTDAIVSWTNKTLDHPNAIFDVGGHRLEETARKVIKRLGPVPIGQAVVTYAAGNLPCKMVIHAAVPNWQFLEDDKKKRLLRKMFINILRKAEKYDVTSLGIPPLTSEGIAEASTFVLPKQEVATIICEVLSAIKCNELKEVHLVDISDQILALIAGRFSQMHNLADEFHEVNELGADVVASTIEKRAETTPSELNRHDRVKVFISCGDITKLKADAIVCSNDEKLSCSSGLANDLALLAGDRYKEKCKEAAKEKKLHSSDAVSIRTEDLGTIINVVVPRLKKFSWKLKKPDSGVYKRVLRASYQNALNEAKNCGVTSLAVSPLGIGERLVPNTWIVEAISHFIKSLVASEKQLKEIHIVDTSNVLVTRLRKSLSKHISSDSVGQIIKQLQPTAVKDATDTYSCRLHPLQTAQSDNIGFETEETVKEGIIDSAPVQVFPVINPKIPCGFLTANNIQVLIHESDITRLKVDAIVSWSNRSLDHRVGITKAIFDVGGHRLEEMARKVIKRLGPVPIGQAVVTYAGNLPCKMVIHAVRPCWPFVDDHGESNLYLKLLRKTFNSILRTADKYVVTSLGIPAGISGIVGSANHDAGVCERSMDLLPETNHQVAKAIYNVLAKKHCRDLKEVHLVDSSDDVLSLLGEYFFEGSKQEPTKDALGVVELDHDVTSSAIQRRILRTLGDVRNHSRVKFFISRGDIMKVNADAVMCFNDKNLSSSTGLAKCAAEEAGNQYKIRCEKATNERRLTPSDVVCIKTMNLPLIINVIAPYLRDTPKPANHHDAVVYRKLLRASFKNAIDKAVECGVSRLAIAPFSFADQQRIPNSWVADTMCKVLSNVLKTNQQINEIHIVDTKTERIKFLHSKLKKFVPITMVGINSQQDRNETNAFNDTASLKNFQIRTSKPRRISTQIDNVTKEVCIQSPSPEKVFIPQHTVPCGFLIGSKMQVLINKCDIKILQVDAIVNFTNTNFDHPVGIGKAIFDAAGAEVESEVRDRITRSGPMTVPTTVLTSAGGLSCKKIIHAVGPSFVQDEDKKRHCLETLRETFIKVINAAEENSCKTLAVPAVVSGIFGVPKHDIADDASEMIANVFKVGKHEVARILCESLASAETKSVKVIYLVDKTDERLTLIGGYFLEMSRKKWRRDLQDVSELSHDVVSSKIEACLKRRRQELLIDNQLRIFVYCDDIMTVNTDAVVCANDGQLSCSSGLAKHIADSIGKSYKSRCRKAATSKKLKPSDAVPIKTDKHGVIINVIVPQFTRCPAGDTKSDGGTYTQSLRLSFQNAIHEAKMCGALSLALSPLGADQEGVSNYWIVDALCQCLKGCTESDHQLKEIHVVGTNKDLLLILKSELKKRLKRPSSIVAAVRQPVSMRKCSIPCGFLTMNMIEVFIHKCDITEIQVDAIVNHTNGNLDHATGVAKAIFRAAGPEMKKERRRILRRSGRLSECETVVTSAGRLPCKIVIHAVGPKWVPSDIDPKPIQCWRLLHNTFINVLDTADKQGVNTLAIPAVTSGVFGATSSKVMTLVYEALMNALKVPRRRFVTVICDVITDVRARNLKEVHLVDDTDQLLSLLGGAFLQRMFTKTRKQFLDVVRLDGVLVSKTIQRRLERKQKQTRVDDRVKVFVHCDEITMVKADAIVCPNDRKLSCASGPAKDIADSAGNDYKKRCKDAARLRTPKSSDVISIHTDKHGDIINVVMPRLRLFSKKNRLTNDESYKNLLRASFKNALKEARKFGSSSLVMYPLGAEEESISETWVADAMCETLSNCVEDAKQLKEIHIVHKDNKFLAFLWKKLHNANIEVEIKPKIRSSETTDKSLPRETSMVKKDASKLSVTELHDESVPLEQSDGIPCGFLTLNIIQVYIHKCDIRKLHVDALVNATDRKLDNASGMAKAISDAAGRELEHEGRRIINGAGPLRLCDTAVTSAGSLPCELVIHAVFPAWKLANSNAKKEQSWRQLQQTLANILRTADEYGINSLAMSAVISGNAAIPEHDVAPIIRDTLAPMYTVPEQEFAQTLCQVLIDTNPRTLREVHIVDTRGDVLRPIAEEFRQKNSQRQENGLLKVIQLGQDTVSSTISRRLQGRLQELVIDNRVKVFVSSEDILKLNVDAIVCPNDEMLSSSAGVARHIADVAGSQYKRLCSEAASGKDLQPPDVVCVNADGLGIIINVVVPNLQISFWTCTESDDYVYREILQTSFLRALDEARKCDVSSLAIYPLGADEDLVPSFWVVDKLCQALLRRSSGDEQIKEIHIVHKNKDLVKFLWRELKKRIYRFNVIHGS